MPLLGDGTHSVLVREAKNSFVLVAEISYRHQAPAGQQEICGCLVLGGKQPGAVLGTVVSKGGLARAGVFRKEMQVGMEPGGARGKPCCEFHMAASRAWPHGLQLNI